MSDHAKDADEIFRNALQMPAAEQSGYLDEACGGDEALRLRVDNLLGRGGLETADSGPFSGNLTGSFDRPAEDPYTTQGTTHSQTPLNAGKTIAGRYVLKRVIGEGGMGSVYLAEQTEPVKRHVALKLIKGGHDSKSVLARFDAERQALAIMDHPNIARVYDGGTTDDGQPFFVMELVNGVPLTEYCDGRRLGVRGRLELFSEICLAVQHAHQKGIIHRDLKPGNVLVTEVDGRPTPKVIDFGVAKATEQKLTDLSLADFGAIVGTPAYMSPEQANPSGIDIDTRTDIYALGVILYELLTGSPPIDSETLAKGEIFEILRMVREVEPPRPSTKISSSVNLPNVAANRGTDPTRLSKLLKGELDWVVMKAIEKDRNRRYETASAFARDIQSYLSDEVVDARPPTRTYRIQKFIRKHRGQVLAASLVLLALVGGIIGTTIGLFEARRQAELFRKATTEKEVALQNESLRAEAERQAKLNAQAMTRNALQSNNVMVFEIQSELENRPSMQSLRIKLLSQARAGLVEILNQADDQVEPNHAIISTHFQLGDLEWNLGNTLAAKTEFQKALDLSAAMVASNPSDRTAQFDLSNAYTKMGDAAKQSADTEGALQNFTLSRAINKRLVEANANDATAIRNLGIDHAKIGDVLIRQGKTDEALRAYSDAIELRKNLIELQTDSLIPKQDLAASYAQLGEAHWQMGDAERALEYFKQGRDVLQALTNADPQNATWKSKFASSLIRVANMVIQLGDIDQSIEIYENATSILQNLVDLDPQNAELRRELGGVNERLGDARLFNGETAEALELYKISLGISELLADLDPTNAELQRDLSVHTEKVGDAFVNDSRADEAIPYYQRALDISQQLTVADPENFQARRDVAFGYNKLAEGLIILGRIDEALTNIEKGLAERKRLATLDPENAQAKVDVLKSYWMIAEATMKGGNYVSAEKAFIKTRDEISVLQADGLLTDPEQLFSGAPFHIFEQELMQRIKLCEMAEVAQSDIEYVVAQTSELVPALFEIHLKALKATGEFETAVAASERYVRWVNETEVENRGLLRYGAAGNCAQIAANLPADSPLRERMIAAAISQLGLAEKDGYFESSAIKSLEQDDAFESIRTDARYLAMIKSWSE